jgi:hypothetical protein
VRWRADSIGGMIQGKDSNPLFISKQIRRVIDFEEYTDFL